MSRIEYAVKWEDAISPQINKKAAEDLIKRLYSDGKPIRPGAVVVSRIVSEWAEEEDENDDVQ